MKRFNISLSTFYRYISVVRAYVWEKDFSEIIYDHTNNTYILLKDRV